MKIYWIDSCESTNAAAVEFFNPAEPVIVATRCQTAGRGQKGNHWEAEPFKNLTFSAVWHPEDFAARDQFSISEAVALAVVDLLREAELDAQVKWPNDIYIGDRKICGILIEHSVTGMNIDRTIAGIGINVNQRVFRSDAPNPVSMSQITDTEYPLESLLEDFGRILENRLAATVSDDGRSDLHEELIENLWRFDRQPYPFRDSASGKRYKGRILDLEPTGLLTIEDCNSGEKHKYAFKEVEFLLY